MTRCILQSGCAPPISDSWDKMQTSISYYLLADGGEIMPKNSADPKHDRANKKADKKSNQQNHAHLTEEPQMLNANKAEDYVPSLNGVTKNET